MNYGKTARKLRRILGNFGGNFPPACLGSPLGLGKLELVVMQFVWQQEEAGKKTPAVKDAFTAFYPKRKFAYATVAVAFKRLEKKGWLLGLPAAHKATFFYRSTRSRREVGKQLMDWVTKAFLDGDLI